VKLGPNAPCWCGSGKKFKRCHRDRESDTPVLESQLRHEVGQHFRVRTCMHWAAPDECRGGMIGAHTVQRRGAIACIVDEERKVLAFDPGQPDHFGQPSLQRIGWRRASVFNGFCAQHDRTFAPVEARPFVGNLEQCFLVGYRAICHELYQKKAADEASPILRDGLDRGRTLREQVQIQHMLAVGQAGRQKGLRDIQALKESYDDALSRRDLETNFASCVVQFRGDICLASTGLMHPDFDVHNQRIQNLSDPAVPIQGLSFGVLATENGGAVAFSWRRADTAVSQFIASLCDQPPESISSVLVEFMFAYVSNTYFSSEWWEGLAGDQQRRLRGLAGTSIQYGRPVNYSGSRHVGWTQIETARS
jgi:hypothetical protein